MKNTRKNMGSFATAKLQAKRLCLLAALATAMLFVSCNLQGLLGGDDDDKKSSGGGDTISGSTITSGTPVSNPNGIIETDFSYYSNGGWHDGEGNSGYTTSHISDYFNGSSSVTISGGSVTIKLGVPKDEYLEDFGEDFPEGLTVNPIEAKSFQFDDEFCTSDGNYSLRCLKDNMLASLWYADRDVTITGTTTLKDYTLVLNVSLKKGWNYYFGTYDEATKTVTGTSSVSQPSGYTWTVFEY